MLKACLSVTQIFYLIKTSPHIHRTLCTYGCCTYHTYSYNLIRTRWTNTLMHFNDRRWVSSGHTVLLQIHFRMWLFVWEMHPTMQRRSTFSWVFIYKIASNSNRQTFVYDAMALVFPYERIGKSFCCWIDMNFIKRIHKTHPTPKITVFSFI